jgi:hypothetical protein
VAAKICRRSSSALGEREGRNRAEQSRGERKRGREGELEEEIGRKKREQIRSENKRGGSKRGRELELEEERKRMGARGREQEGGASLFRFAFSCGGASLFRFAFSHAQCGSTESDVSSRTGTVLLVPGYPGTRDVSWIRNFPGTLQFYGVPLNYSPSQ